MGSGVRRTALGAMLPVCDPPDSRISEAPPGTSETPLGTSEPHWVLARPRRVPRPCQVLARPSLVLVRPRDVLVRSLGHTTSLLCSSVALPDMRMTNTPSTLEDREG